MRVEVRGQAGILRALRAWTIAYPAALRAALYSEGQEWADDAVPRAPKQTGFLQGSAFVTRPEGARAVSVVELGFGADYASTVHRRNDTATGVPHWLGETMRAKIPGFAQRVLSRTRRFALSRQGVEAVAPRWPSIPKTGDGPERRGTSPAGQRGRR